MKKFFAIFAVAAMLFACEEPVPETTLSLDDEANATLNLATDAVQKVVAFTTNAAWTAAADAQWITVTPAEGVAGTAIELTIAVAKNDTFDNRAGKVTITAAEKALDIIVNQTQTDEVNIGELEILYVGYEGGEVELPVNHNIEYTVTSDADWAVVGGTRALTTTKTIINVEKNGTAAERTATLLVEAAGFEYEVYLVQSGYIFSVNSTTVVPQIGNVTISDATEGAGGIVSIALWDGKLVVCPGDGSATKLVNKATGAVEGDLVTGGFVPYYVANDDAGNLVMSNRVHNNVWDGITSFEVWYLAPGSTTAVMALKADWQTRHNGCGMAVRGDITGNAAILVTEEFPANGGTNVVNGWEFVGGVPGAFQPFALTGFRGAYDWFGDGYWRNAPYINAFALMGTTLAEGAVMLGCYPDNGIYTVAGNVCTPVQAEIFNGNYAANAIDMIFVNGKAYVALSAAGHWASWCPAQTAVFCVEGTTITPVATPSAVSYCTTDYMGGTTSDVCLEAVEGGLNVYRIDNSTTSLEGFFLAL